MVSASLSVPLKVESKTVRDPMPTLQPCADCVPDFIGLSMRRVLQMAKERDFMVHMEGTGKAVSQRPLPGTPLHDVSECWVTFRPMS